MATTPGSSGRRYHDVAAAIGRTGMMARGGFEVAPDDGVEPMPDGAPVRSIVMIGNIGGAMWTRFRAEQRPGPDPLDAWTRAVLGPVAVAFGAEFVHPSDEPFRPFQRWARRADDVWSSPIGLLVHPELGLWHAYRGALLFDYVVSGLPAVGGRRSPCLDCVGQPCLHGCPVDAFHVGSYDTDACRSHVAGPDDPDCLHLGCAARLACPVADTTYDADQMEFHMRAFVGMPP